jgi:hypothetical protein
MSEPNPEQVEQLIQQSKELIAKMNQVLAKFGAPVRFSEQPIEIKPPDQPGPQSPPA